MQTKFTFFNATFPKILALLFLTSSVTAAQAQFSTYYNFGVVTGGSYTAITGGTLHSSGATMNNAVFSETLPFTFAYAGNNYTTIYLSENGFLSFGATSPAAATLGISGVAAAIPTASPYSRDLGGKTGASLRSEVLGIAPNRIYVAQWTAMSNQGGTNQNYNFQVQLNETTGIITLSSSCPACEAYAIAVSFPITWNATMVMASRMTGFTFPGIMDEPG